MEPGEYWDNGAGATEMRCNTGPPGKPAGDGRLARINLWLRRRRLKISSSFSSSSSSSSSSFLV
jgi:hypothetical protein